MRQRARRAAFAIGFGTLIGVTVGATAASRSLQASLRAAYAAFRDPSLIHAREPREPREQRALAAINQPAECVSAMPGEGPEALKAWMARDFEPPVEEDLDDPEGATIASLAMPDLRVPLTRGTMRFVRLFARSEEGRAAFLQRYRRAAAYRDFIEHALREAGLPEDLLWVAAIESSFDPTATSPAGASGLWQFMPKTGELYGLHRDDWVDERRNLLRSTTAAVAHLRDLYERFGRWDLALAAYNAGHERIVEAMDRVIAARDPEERGPIGLAELAQAGAIPQETANYVPQIMAFALVAANRARFGLDQPDLDAPRSLQMGEIAVPAGTRLRTLARAAGVSAALLREYNPQLLRDRVPPTGGDYVVALPADRVARTLATFPAYHEHETLAAGADEDGAEPAQDPSSTVAASWVTGAAGAGRGPDLDPSSDEGSLPPRPGTLGKNRLPSFIPPGQLPTAMRPLGDPRALQARLPVVMIGGGVGWRGGFEEDPLGIFSGRAPRAARIKGRQAEAIEKQILGSLGEERAVRIWLPGGIAAEIRRDPAAPLVAVSLGVAGAGDGAKGADGLRAGGVGPAIVGEARTTISVPPRDLDVALALTAGRLRLMLAETGPERVAELRRHAGRARREALERAPYGRAWLALGEALFPAGHPLAGTVLGARDDPEAARDLLLVESLRRERQAATAVVSISGDVTRAQVEEALARAFGNLPRDPELAVGPHPREERLVVEDAVNAPRLLYGWLGPGEGEPGEASLRVAMEILAGQRIARLTKALVTEAQVAAEVKGRLDPGPLASVAALEIAPAPGRDAAQVEQRLDAELTALATDGPTWNELSLAKILLKHQIDRELARVQGKAPPAPGGTPTVSGIRLREALSPGSLERLGAALEEVSPTTVRNAVRRTFDRRHRVVVTTQPRGL